MPPLPVVLIAIATAVDGDTIDLAGQRVRLYGIDAPEIAQTCHIGATAYPCGKESLSHLVQLIAGQTVTCTERARDRWRRLVAVCKLPDGTDIGRQMVRNGHALAFVRYSLDYQPDERYAQAARAGLWRGSFVPPWEWRHR